MNVLGIETSCDETAIALYSSDQGLLSHQLYSQLELHRLYGGVVPELASRDHIKKITPLVKSVLKEANKSYEDIDGIAYTAGPGLIGALMVGAVFARSLAYALNIPAVAVNHMEGHLLAPLLESEQPEFPFIALLVSGGHTQIVRVEAIGEYELLGDSLDDAAGEAFDKVARLLDLPYPGGPQIAQLAEDGNPERFSFPRPMLDRPGLDFSFSGLKTAVLNTMHKHTLDRQTKADIACAFQDAVVDTLVAKCKRALEETGVKQLIVAGGVSANLILRERIQQCMKKLNAKAYFPRLEFSTDNGAMIAFAGYQRLSRGESEGLSVNLYPRWPL